MHKLKHTKTKTLQHKSNSNSKNNSKNNSKSKSLHGGIILNKNFRGQKEPDYGKLNITGKVTGLKVLHENKTHYEAKKFNVCYKIILQFFEICSFTNKRIINPFLLFLRILTMLS